MTMRRKFVKFAILAMTAGLVCSGSIAIVEPVANAAEQSKFDLTPGYYIYLGQQPGRTAPNAFTINSSGSVFWQDPNASEADDKLPGLELNTRPLITKPTRTASSQPTSEQYESITYPFIKWKPKPLSSLPGAFVQLSTTYEQNALKYKVTLFKSKNFQNPPRDSQGPHLTSAGIPDFPIDVELLDGNGFKLVQFTINARQWDVIPGTNVLEGRDQLGCNEWDYKRSRDYAVK